MVGDAGVGLIFSSIGTVFKFVDFCAKIKEVPLENRVFCRLISGVRTDLQEISRILRNNTVKYRLELDPRRKQYVDGTIRRVNDALNDIGEYVESVNRDEERFGGITMVHRFEWVLGHQAKLATRERELASAHQALLHAMTTLHALECQQSSLPSYSEAVAQDDGGVLLSPDSRWRRRRLTKSVSCGDLIDLSDEQESGRAGVKVEEEEVLPPSRSAENLPQHSETTSSLLDTPVIQLGPTITSVSDIWNPPPSFVEEAAQETKRKCFLSDSQQKIAVQEPIARIHELPPTPEASYENDVAVHPPEIAALKPIASERSTAEEQRRRRRAKQQIAFGL